MAKSTEIQSKFVLEFTDDTGKLDARWHYDYSKFPFGPILVEEFNMPRKERKKKTSKKSQLL